MIFFRKIAFSLPFQLLLINLKRNQILLLSWVLLFSIVIGGYGQKFGIPYLFLDPEYMNDVGLASMAILGFAFGIFTMSYNLTMYILESYRFRFLATIPNPFFVFCINNSIIPLIFFTTFGWIFLDFQTQNGLQQYHEIIAESFGFIFGFLITVLITVLYFKISEIYSIAKIVQELDKKLRNSKLTRAGVIQKIHLVKIKKQFVDYYLDLPLKIVKTDNFLPYDKALVSKVFDKYHFNALVLQLTGFLILLGLGIFKDYAYMQIPAGASILLLISIIIMFSGAFSHWLKGWSIYVLLFFIVTFNFLINSGFVNPDYQVYGLNYNTTRCEYSNERISSLVTDSLYESDYKSGIKMLENWKSKFKDKTQKPKMIFICASGGGQRAAVWTLRSLQIADSVCKGDLLKHTMSITGASGGLIGAAYYRELYLRSLSQKEVVATNKIYTDNISRDILNPVCFSLVVNDLFIRYQTFTVGTHSYIKDRGYAFELQLNKNTDYVLNKKVMDYKDDEFNARIPLLILSPSVVNGGRKLYISTQPVSYMSNTSIDSRSDLITKINGIEFNRFFKDQEADNLLFTSALRMCATFPYITPNVNLPSVPSMEIMDAGLTDNYGISDAVRFMFVFREWIKENTSDVIILSIRDSQKKIEIVGNVKQTLLQKVLSPIGTLYNNWDNLQDTYNDNYVEYAHSFLGDKVKTINLEYSGEVFNIKSGNNMDEDVSGRASLSWHLTKKEKENLKQNINTSKNRKSINELKQILTY